MAEAKSQTNRVIGFLTLLFVLVFAGILVMRYAPWGTPQQTSSVEQSATAHDPVPVTLMLSSGEVQLELWRDLAPKHVERITTLASEGFYDGIVFHRVIDGFMAQTGDPTGTGTGGSQLPDLEAEFSDEPFVRGSLGMARSASPNSANSQFFIMFDEASHLNGQYTNFGRVVSGMEHIDALKKGSSADNGTVVEPDSIVSMSTAE